MHNRSFVSATLLSNLRSCARRPHHFTAAALGLLLNACGDGGGSTAEGGTGNVVGIPGFAVDCTPQVADDPLLCIAKEDWQCEQNDFYTREALCAWFTEGPGTPSEYDNVPQLVEYDPDGPDGEMPPVDELDCAAPPDGVVSGWDGQSRCDECRVCGIQIQGGGAKSGEQDYGWDELDFCPADLNELATPGGFCIEGEATPTTGDENDTGMGGSGLWKCMGSWTIMGTMIETDLPQSQTDIYMSPPDIPKCVNATDEHDARDNCFDVCEFMDYTYEQEAAASDSKNWVSFNCADLNGFTPLETFNPFECHGGGPMNPPPTPFMATGTLAMGDLTAQTDQLSGSLDFSLDACDSTGLCPFTLGKLEAGPRTTQGVVTSTFGESTTFAVADLTVALLQPVRGVLDQQSGAMKFTSEGLFASVSTGVTTLDGVAISAGLRDATFVARGAQGRWDGTKLTIDLGWSMAGATLSLRIAADWRRP